MPAVGQSAPLPEIDGQETFDELVRKLSVYVLLLSFHLYAPCSTHRVRLSYWEASQLGKLSCLSLILML